MSGLIAFGSMIFLWFFIKMVMNPFREETNKVKSNKNRNYENYYQHDYMKNESTVSSPSYRYLSQNIYNND